MEIDDGTGQSIIENDDDIDLVDGTSSAFGGSDDGTQPASCFGLIIPSCPVHTNFVPLDVSRTKYELRLTSPGDIPSPSTSITEIVFFMIPNSSLSIPTTHGALCYWQISAISTASDANSTNVRGVAQAHQPQQCTGFELLGAITHDCPTTVFHTGWSEHEQLAEITAAAAANNNNQSQGCRFILTIGVSVEPVSNMQNLGAIDNVTRVNNRRLYVAQKIAYDLFNFMKSFDTGGGGNRGHMIVPNNIFDRWFQRFENRFKRDPNFFLKQKDEDN